MISRKLLKILAILWSIGGCSADPSSPTRAESSGQGVASVRPQTVQPTHDLNLPIYELDTRRGTLVTRGERFILDAEETFTAFASGQFGSGEPQHFWVLIDLDFPQYIIVTLSDVVVLDPQARIEPAYVTETEYACPLLYPQPLRLTPLGTLPARTLLYLFADPYNPSDFLPPMSYGHYTEPLLSVGYVTPQGTTFMGFTAALCLSYPTPWNEIRDLLISVERLGSVSEFRDRLVNTLVLADSTNLASSLRETMRHQEPCEKILRDIPESVDTTWHNPAGDVLPTAVVFLCAEPDPASAGALTYRMAPMTIGVNSSGLHDQSVALLVINFSPPNPNTNMEQPVTFGAYSYSDVYRASEIIAIPAFDGTFGELATGIYRIDGGIRNALWVIIKSFEYSSISRFQYAAGAFDESVLDEYYLEQPWWNPETTTTGRITHD